MALTSERRGELPAFLSQSAQDPRSQPLARRTEEEATILNSEPTRSSKTTKTTQRFPNDALDADAAAQQKRLLEAQTTYGRGEQLSTRRIKDRKLRANLAAQEQKIKDAVLQARDAEILLEHQPGLLEPEHELEKTWRVRQQDLVAELPVQTARKGFELALDQLGPYVADYSRNGRDLLLAGRRGHVATFDWREGKLGCELQLGERVRDARWLHNNQMFAVAQKQHVFIYDHAGVEIHRLDKLIQVTHMEFLPFHFLLASVGKAGYLKYLDTSTGQLVVEMPTKQGAPTALGQNPHNAIIHVGHQNGQVSLWSPNAPTPVVKLLAHRGPVRALAVDREGRYMVSVGQDSKMAVWDVRKHQEVANYLVPRPGCSVAISDRGLTAVGWGTSATVWQGLFDKAKATQEKVARPYMAWGAAGQAVERVAWCPLEDVLGIGHDKGFASIIVPGAGEPNYDALEVNPYETARQRQEAEVRSLLHKLQPETISLDPDFIGSLDLASAAEQKKRRDLDRPAEDKVAKLKNRGRGKNSSLRKFLRKQGQKNVVDDRKVRIQEALAEQRRRGKDALRAKQDDYGPALARFARKGE